MKKILISFLLLISFSFAKEKKIEIAVGESTILNVEKVKAVIIGDPNIASVKTISDTEILISGKSVGNTTLIIKYDGKEDTIKIFVSEVIPEKPMIEINVQVYEIQKKNLGDFGITWHETIKALSVGEESIPPLFQVGTFERLKKLEATLNLLVEKGYAKLLAKPRLLTTSGGKASFLSGGEIPTFYADAQRIHIEYKSYGVGLEIQPSLDVKGNIYTEIKAEVSNIDQANAVVVGSSSIPALKTRWVKTSLCVKKGVTIVIAGLIQNEESKKTKGIPIISEIPLIGEIFKFTHIENVETELVIFVTPTIAGQE
jgi:pilus assembly protein CpaC